VHSSSRRARVNQFRGLNDTIPKVSDIKISAKGAGAIPDPYLNVFVSKTKQNCAKPSPQVRSTKPTIW
jgi:hypothetical protein